MTRIQRREADRLRTEIRDGIAEFHEVRARSLKVRRCGTMIDLLPAWGLQTSIVIPGFPRTFHYIFSPRIRAQAYPN